MITENDLFNVQKAIVYSFRNIPEFSTQFLDTLHDALYPIGGIKTLNYNSEDMSVLVDIMVNKEEKMNIYNIINQCYVETVINCIASNYTDNSTAFLTNVPNEVIRAVLPVCCTILDITALSKDSLVFRINLHN